MYNMNNTQQYSSSIPSSAIPCFISPRILKFFLLMLVMLTAIYSKSYVGEYQLFINNHFVGTFYVLIESLTISLLLNRLTNWKVVLMSFSIISLLEILQIFRFTFMTDLTQRSLLRFLFGTTFDPNDFTYYGLGAVMSILALWLLSSTNWSKYTEVY